METSKLDIGMSSYVASPTFCARICKNGSPSTLALLQNAGVRNNPQKQPSRQSERAVLPVSCYPTGGSFQSYSRELGDSTRVL